MKKLILFCLLATRLYATDFGDIPADTDVSTLWVAPSRTLTIGGTALNLSANRAWTTTTILDGIGSPAWGDILIRGTSNWIYLTPGTDGNILTTHGAGASPTWATPTTVTPAALTKTNDTNVTLTLGGTPTTALLQATSLTLGWTGTLAVSRGGTGAGTLTGLVLGNGTSAMTAVTAPSGTVVGTTDTQTLTNKWVKPRSTATPAPGATPAINTDSFDVVSFNSLGTAITSMTTSLTGTPVLGQKLLLGFKDDGTARGITWGASFQSGPATLLATTVISKQHWVGLIYDGTKWTCFASDATGY